MTAVKVISS